MKKKMLAVLLASTMVVAALAGCGAKETQKEESKPAESKVEESKPAESKEEPKEEPKEEIDYSKVDFRIAWWGGEARTTNTMAFIDEFEKQFPGLEVEVEFNGSFNDYFTSMNTQAAGGDLPDVFQMDVGKFYEFANNKQLLELSPLYADGSVDMSNVPDGAIAAGNVCDGTYGVACGLNGFVMHYNPELAAKAGVTIENGMTYSEFFAAAEKVLEKTGARAVAPSLVHETFLRSLGGDVYATSGDAFGFTKDDLKAWGKVYLKGYADDIWATQENTVETATAARYASEEIWCHFESSNQIGSYEKSSGKTLAMVTTPIADNATVVDATYMKPAMLWTVAANTEYPEIAAAFLDFYVNNTVVYDIMGIDRGVPISTKVQEYLTPNLSEADKKQFEYVAYLGEHSTPINLYKPVNGPEAWTNLWNVISEELANDVITTEDQIDKRVDELWDTAQKIITGQGK